MLLLRFLKLWQAALSLGLRSRPEPGFPIDPIGVHFMILESVVVYKEVQSIIVCIRCACSLVSWSVAYISLIQSLLISQKVWVEATLQSSQEDSWESCNQLSVALK